MTDKTFRKICEAEKGFICAECNRLQTKQSINYHHILPKGTFPKFRHYLPNMMPLCFEHHGQIDTNPKGMRIYKELKAKKQELIQKYYQNN